MYEEFDDSEEAKGVCKDRSKWKEVISPPLPVVFWVQFVLYPDVHICM
jgi:hypothetical protein